MKRLEYIDGIKGLGILLVVFGHHLLGMDFLVKWIYHFHVPLFFFISGFLFTRKSYELKFVEFFKRKVGSLLYPYATLSVLVIIWHYFYYAILFPGAVPESTTLEVAMLTATSFGYHAFWFIPCLFCAMILFFVLGKRLGGRISLVLLTLLVLIVDFVFGADIKPFAPYVYKYIYRVIVASSFVLLGSEFRKTTERIDALKESILFFTSAVISVLIFIGFVIFNDNIQDCNLAVAIVPNPLLFYFVSIPTIVFVYYLFKKMPSVVVKLFAFFGRNSLVVLAFHMDVSIEIGWLFVEKSNISLGITLESLTAIFIELIVLTVMILIINKWFKFLLNPSCFKKSKA